MLRPHFSSPGDSLQSLHMREGRCPVGMALPYFGARGPYARILLLRPRVGLAEAHKLSDVQRFFVVLSPESRQGAPRRMIAIGKKRMPDGRHPGALLWLRAGHRRHGQHACCMKTSLPSMACICISCSALLAPR